MNEFLPIVDCHNQRVGAVFDVNLCSNGRAKPLQLYGFPSRLKAPNSSNVVECNSTTAGTRYAVEAVGGKYQSLIGDGDLTPNRTTGLEGVRRSLVSDLLAVREVNGRDPDAHSRTVIAWPAARLLLRVGLASTIGRDSHRVPSYWRPGIRIPNPDGRRDLGAQVWVYGLVRCCPAVAKGCHHRRDDSGVVG